MANNKNVKPNEANESTSMEQTLENELTGANQEQNQKTEQNNH